MDDKTDAPPDSSLIPQPSSLSTRRFRPYLEHKELGVDCLGEIPAHWEVRRIKFAANKIGSGKTPSGGAHVYTYSGIMLIRSQNVHFDRLRLEDTVYITDQTDMEMAGSRVREGDVLLNITGASLGRCCVARLHGQRANVNQHVCIIRPVLQRFDPSFLAYAISSRAVQAQIFNNENGISRDALNFEQVGNLISCQPPLAEQRAIAEFLDGETGKIDVLVAKKKRLIELLQEKRTALITHAVTKGLDPDVPMRDSDVEWLGNIPAHWVEWKMAYLVEIISGGTPNKENIEYWRGEVPWVSPKDMKSRIITDTIDHISQIAIDERGLELIEPPAVLIVVRGMILAHTFPVGLTTLPVTINQDIKALRLNKAADPHFFVYLLQGLGSFVLSLIEEAGHGTKRLRTDLWKSIKVYLPPIEEQQRIAGQLDEEVTKFDRLISQISQGIGRLTEFRTALSPQL
jgi:type I restriction enzyme, S subunit